MKRVKVVQLIGIILFILYIVFVILNAFKVGFIEGRQTLIFSILLAVLSITLIYKGVLLKSSSTLWFSLNLISYAIIIVVFEVVDLTFSDYYYLLSLIPIIASLINLAVFGYMIYIKVIILNITVAVPILLWQFTSLDFWWIIGVGVVSVLLGIIICRLIYDKKEKF